MSIKKFKDPVYGYIEIEDSIVHNIIDTATFQRLRNIRQTSYAPLYPASLHNRFVHSIGVYHLGKMAFSAIQKSVAEHEERETKTLSNLNSLFEGKWDRYRSLFELACLLHDVGHSPFSHTGEEFYRTSRSRTEITVDEQSYLEAMEKAVTDEQRDSVQRELDAAKKYSYRKHLAQLTHDNIFVSSAGENPAPHEIMSCIVGIEAFGSNTEYFKDDIEKSFFARCITGIKYDDVTDLRREDFLKMTSEQHDEVKKKMLLNCFIHMLHSSVIDVDRLDYIIRDASTMGYQSVSVDYNRLLSGIVIVPEDEFNFTIGFHKNAISVIENAVYAHDNEKKWIQGHPTILYDSFLLQKSIIWIEQKIKTDNPDAYSTLFSFDSLTSDGSAFNNMKVRYLGDEDLLHLMKNVYQNKYSEEYFSRNTRRLPVWKSEAEFRNLLTKSERELINRAMSIIMTGNTEKSDSVEVNPSALQEIDAEIEESRSRDLKNMVESHQTKKACFSALLDVCASHEIEQDVALLSTSLFKSNFSKGEVQKLVILFPEGRDKCRLQDVSTTLSSNSPGEEKLIYLYYYPRQGREKIDVKLFVRDLVSAFDRVFNT